MSIQNILKRLSVATFLSLTLLTLLPVPAAAQNQTTLQARKQIQSYPIAFKAGDSWLEIVVCDGLGNELTGAGVTLESERNGETFTIRASAPGFKTSTIKHIRVPEQGTRVYLMLVPQRSRFDMSNVAFEKLPQSDPELYDRIICQSLAPAACQAAYEDMLRHRRDKLAALIDIVEALKGIKIGGRSALSYYQAVDLDGTMARDRFFGYIDKSVVSQLKSATAAGPCGTQSGDTCFTRQKFFRLLHHNATSSFKEIDLDEANVQLTFDEKDTRTINGVECIKVETDIDYYRGFAHFFKEVVPNLLLHRKTDPRKVFYLRWMATRQKRSEGSTVTPFAPPIGLKGKH